MKTSSVYLEGLGHQARKKGLYVAVEQCPQHPSPAKGCRYQGEYEKTRAKVIPRDEEV
jgi:hypothetical protein